MRRAINRSPGRPVRVRNRGGTEQGGSEQDENNPETITGVTFEDQTFTYDGKEHSISVTGDVPDGVTVAYENNSAVNAGTYEAKAVLSGEGYVTLTRLRTIPLPMTEKYTRSKSRESSLRA